MGQFISTRLIGDVAVVTIDNPPVNALSFRVRHPLMQRLETLRDEAHVRAIVLACAGRTFVAGADITEFGKPMQRPNLRDLVALLEAMGKPTVAAIHGTALGGGLELAMGCSFRVAARDARLGLPEVKLGLLPGAGGTIRLPALIGATKALTMIVSGSMIGAAEAQTLGLVDAVAQGELVDEAVAFAEARLAEETPAVPVRDRRDKLEATDLEAFEAEAARLAGRSRGLEAPLAAAQAVRNAVTLPFDEALAAERALFVRLEASEESQAQRHLFFAEREADEDRRARQGGGSATAGPDRRGRRRHHGRRHRAGARPGRPAGDAGGDQPRGPGAWHGGGGAHADASVSRGSLTRPIATGAVG